LKATINPENPVDPVQKRSLAEKTIEDVLLHFGETKRVAIKRYQEFVEKGIKQACPPPARNASQREVGGSLSLRRVGRAF